nr:MAG TPA: helix-turn-helix domain protein [Caudoviricetes sp.]
MIGQQLVGVRIKEAREELGLTQGEFAKELHVSCSTICLYEKGLSTPDALFIRDVAQITSFTADYLLGLSDFK